MILLDDARQLATQTGRRSNGVCMFCQADPGVEHAGQCPSRSRHRILAALEASSALLEAVRRMQGHYERIGERVGGGTYSYCSDCDQPWPCQVAQLAEPADALWMLMDPDAYRENEVHRQYLAYVHEQSERGVTVAHLPQLPEESRTAWVTRMLLAAGVEPS